MSIGEHENPIVAAILSSVEVTAAAVAGDFDSVADQLNAERFHVADSRRKLMDDFIDAIGAVNTDRVMATLKIAAAGLVPGVPANLAEGTLRQVNGTGVDMSRPGVLEMVSHLEAAAAESESPDDHWPADLGALLAAMGGGSESIADQFVSGGVSADHCQTEWRWKVISDRITNAAAAARKGMLTIDSEAELAAVWAEAWELVSS